MAKHQKRNFSLALLLTPSILPIFSPKSAFLSCPFAKCIFLSAYALCGLLATRLSVQPDAAEGASKLGGRDFPLNRATKSKKEIPR